MTTLVLDPSNIPTRASGPILAPPDPAILTRNLAALARSSPRTAELVQSCAPRTDLRFLHTDDGVPSIEVVEATGAAPSLHPNPVRAIASRRRPLREGEQLCEAIDVASTAAVAVMGFGAGYHVRALALRMGRSGVVAVFEPDVGLLRAVLERVDHSEWMNTSNTAIFTDPDDAAAISAALAGVEGIVMMGLTLLEHPPSLERLGESRTRFYRNLQDVTAAIRTTVATTMVQTRVTVGNVARNIGWYVSSPGIGHLAGTRRGTPAIVVSAGPSLQRNIEQLSRPGVRDRFTIIAAQTVLKSLLARGIKPHYVVALDHSEISARFYEGLTAADVEGVTLVVEPKVSPAVPRAFPGQILLARDPFLDMLLGPELSRDMGTLPPGATVAHLAYYLARHLGADPVVLVGQDLGFTDGQYYAANAAIHDVWACELNQFNTIERMEWERVKRMGSHLRRATDHLARPIYTDEQLATYLVQFERDFLADTQRGMTIIDATEGGVAKRHTQARRLREVVDATLAGSGALGAPTAPVAQPSPVGVRRAEERVREVLAGVHRVGELSRRSAELLGEMLTHHADQRRVSRLIDDLHRVRDEVERITPAIDLSHYLNQVGAFSRMRADRAIHLDPTLSPLERQKKEIQRDIANVEQLAHTADDLVVHLAAAADSLVRWQTGPGTPTRTDVRVLPSVPRPDSNASAHAVVTVDDPAFALNGEWSLRLTVQRLQRCRRLESIVVLAVDDVSAGRALGTGAWRIPVRVRRVPSLFGTEHRTIQAARAPASDCWRGGLAGASVFDEALAPEETLHALEELRSDAALIVRHDWCVLDPMLCDEIIERAARANGTHRFAFSQAPPGVAGVVLNRAVLADLVRLRRGSSPFATLGGLLSYMPSAPATDSIGKDVCAVIDPRLRDCGMRLVPDSPARAAAIRHALEETGADADAATIFAAVERLEERTPAPPTSLTVEAPRGGESWSSGVLAAVECFAHASPGGMLTIRTAGVDAASLRTVISTARTAGEVFVHIRAACDSEIDSAALLGLGAEILSLDLPMPTDEVRWTRAHRQLESLIAAARAGAGGTVRPWIVPRLIKCDASYPVIEGFFDRWLLTTGAATIDAMPAARAGERIEPLPVPASARARFARTAMYIRGDGGVWPGDVFDRACDGAAAASVRQQSFEEAWSAVRAARRVKRGGSR